MKDILERTNTLESLMEVRKAFNELYNIQEKKIKNKLLSEKVMHNTFITTLTIFESLMGDIVDLKNGRNLINNFIDIIKENKDLTNLYILNEQFSNEDITGDEVLNLIKIIGNVEKKNISEDISRLNKILMESINSLNKDLLIESTLEDISNAIQYKLTTPETIKNTRKHKLMERLIISNFPNQKTIEEKQVTRELSEMYSSLKGECINLINEKLNETNENGELIDIKNKLSLKTFNEKTVNEDIEHLKKLKILIK